MAARKNSKRKASKSPARTRSSRKRSGSASTLKPKGDLQARSLSKFGFPKKMRPNRSLLWLVLFGFIVGLLYFGRKYLVVAMVNGRPIYRWTVVKQLEKLGGAQIYDEYLRRKLVDQELQKRGIKVSDEEVQQEIDNVRAQFESQGVSLEDAMSQDNITQEDLFAITKYQKGLSKLVEPDIEVTDEDIQSFYDENKSFYADQTLDDVKGDIQSQLRQQKVQQKAQEFLTKLVNDANIQVFIEY